MTDQCCPMGTYGTDSGGYPRAVCSCLENCDCTGWGEEHDEP